jgi:cytochrome c551/c552
MKTLKVMAALLIGGLTLSATLMFGKAEYAKTEKKGCTYCHVDVKKSPKELNDVGKCYAKNKHSLKGCEEKAKESEKK